jgi:acyl-coenzyme A thioesterase PaaI-like protein
VLFVSNWFVALQLQSPQGYLLSGVTATLADQLGSAAIFSSVVGLSGVDLSDLGLSGLGLSGVSLEISVSFVDTATVGVRLHFLSLSLQYLQRLQTYVPTCRQQLLVYVG